MTYRGRGSSDTRREAFLRSGPEMVDFLERQGMRFEYADGWSDYYDDLPGGQPRGRSLVAEVFDVNELGEWKSRAVDVSGHRAAAGLRGLSRRCSWSRRRWRARRWRCASVWRLLKNKLLGRDVRGGGAAIQGRMLQIALREKLPISDRDGRCATSSSRTAASSASSR